MTSTRPYLIRALYEWIEDNHRTPHILVNAEAPGVEVPKQHVQEGRIVLNINAAAVRDLRLGNDWIEFNARFGGVARTVHIPVTAVLAIYARENGQSMAFPPPVDLLSSAEGAPAALSSAGTPAAAPAEEASAAAAEDRVVQLVGVEDGHKDDGGDAPRPPPSQGGARPSLKRIK